MSPARRSLARPVALLLLLALGACAGPARERVDGWSEVGSGETIVVGRIELVPPLRKDEQKIEAMNSGSFENKMFVLADDNYRVIKGEPVTADFTGRIEAPLEQTFFARSSDKPFFILGGMMWLEIGRSASKAYFPGGLKVSLRPGDKAVYVGTVRYHRNEFFEITRVLIVDDYERANSEFRKKFGTRIPLRKALLTPVK
jgi:hypothetical protein